MDCPVSQSFPGLESTSASLVHSIYTFPSSCDTAETRYIVLIQDDCVSIYWRESMENITSEWNHVSYTIDEHQISDLNCSVNESGSFIWIAAIYDDLKDGLTLVHLRFDKASKTIKLYLRKSYSSTFLTQDVINKCQLRQSIINIACLANGKSALSVPGPANTIKIYLYDLPTSNKILLTTLHANNISSSCILPVDDWDHTFIVHFDHRIQLWDSADPSLVSSVRIKKSIFDNKICFNAMQDKGLVYLFIGDPRSSAIEVIAVNPKTSRYATLMQCNVFEADLDNPLGFNKIRRNGNSLILIKDDEVVLFDLATNRSVINCNQAFIIDASIGFVKNKVILFAATTYGKIINLLDS